MPSRSPVRRQTTPSRSIKPGAKAASSKKEATKPIARGRSRTPLKSESPKPTPSKIRSAAKSPSPKKTAPKPVTKPRNSPTSTPKAITRSVSFKRSSSLKKSNTKKLTSKQTTIDVTKKSAEAFLKKQKIPVHTKATRATSRKRSRK